MCPGLCLASVSVAENCEWGMERAEFHAPFVVENRPFILDVQKSGRDLQRCLDGFAAHVMLRRGSTDKQGEGGAERLVGGAKVARNRR